MEDTTTLSVHLGDPLEDQSSQPAADESAPRGYLWDKTARHWRPRKNGPLLYGPDGPIDISQDPSPGWARKPEKPRKKLKYSQVPKQVKDDIAGLSGMVGTPILALLQSADPYCGTALAQNFENIIDAMLPLMCRSEKVVKYFSEDSTDWLLWGKLALALKPVGQAVLEHHVFKTVHVVTDPETGQPAFVRGTAPPPSGDPLQPPVPPEEVPAYIA